MIHTAELDLDQLGTDDSENKPIEFDVWSYWYDKGYPVEAITEAHSVVHKKPDDEDTAHIVVKVETLSKPLDQADIVADSLTVYSCDCKGYQFHYSVDLDEKYIAEWGSCPHIEAVDPATKAKNDEKQSTL